MSQTLRILIVDDDEVDRMIVKRALRSAGVEADVAEAGDVTSATQAMRAGQYDCVLLDFQLPGGDGLRVLRDAREAGITTPIIMLTGQGDDQVIVNVMKAGASDYMTKGAVTPERLEQTIRSVVRLHEAETQMRLAEQARHESEARFRVLHETSPDGFMIFRSVRDDAGAIVDFVWEYVNPAGEKISRRAEEDLRGRRMLEEMPGNLTSGLFDFYRQVVESGEPGQSEVRYQYENLDLWLRITAAKLEDGFAVSFSDITRRKRAEEERERAIASRNRFYAAMSHEIRTPMNAILGYTDLLLAGAYGPLMPPHLKGIERTHRAAQHLLELVNDVLDLSKLEAGKLDLQVEPTIVPVLVNDLFATVQPLAEERGSELQFSSEGCDEPIQTDPRRLRQILLNLLSNAIKFGGAKPVEVLCSSTADRGMCIAVKDQGAGIPAAETDRIFEEFVQLTGNEERGTGLGLPISRRLAEHLGGELEVESAEGTGSIFRLYLPAVAPDQPTPEEPAYAAV